MSKILPAILGGPPVVASDALPKWPASGAIETAALAEVTEGDLWAGFGHRPAKWRAICEQLVASTAGYDHGVEQSNGTLAIAAGLRAQLHLRDAAWASGRDTVLVADLTHASAHHGVILGVAAELGRAPRLVPVPSLRDATMDPSLTAEYLDRQGEQVLAIVPATMYGNFGAIDRFVEMATKHDLCLHHDNALGGVARYPGKLAVTASISGQGEGKATPAGAAGMALTNDPELARLLRAESDGGTGLGRLDPIPYSPEQPPLAAGNQRLAEQPAALLAIQWLRGLHARLQARESRRQVAELLDGLLDAELLWNPPTDSEYPPFFTFYPAPGEALEKELGLSPEDLRAAFCAEGICAERGFVQTHLDPPWRHHAEGVALPYERSANTYRRAFVIHNKFLRCPEFPEWSAEILKRIISHRDRLRGVADGVPEMIAEASAR